MKCCIHCFDDQELKGFIRSNSTDKGLCDYCGSKNSQLIEPREFEEKLVQLIQIYEPIGDTDRSDTQPGSIHDKLQKEWGIFGSGLDKKNREKLLQDIVSISLEESHPLMSTPVERRIVIDNLDQAEVLEKVWDKFSREITSSNRFFLGENIDLELLKRLFAFHTKTYKRGKLFHRARISNKDGFPIKKMGKPPAKDSTSGRANPMGIPYLYLSVDPKTVIYECRATHLDYVTIAEFKLADDLRVVSLRQVENISPFLLEEKIEEYLQYQKYLKRLEKELSKPIRRHDHKLDYLPTQYLCEYVKFLGYDAIECGSSLYNGGINLAVFNDEKLNVRKSEVHEVISIDLDTKVIGTANIESD